MTEAIGWVSSLILLLTISKQIYKQWQAGSSQGVSKWLFLGQMAASAGFTVYSWMVSNWVFVVTNSLMLLSACVGLAILFWHRRREASGESAAHQTPRPAQMAANSAHSRAAKRQ